MNADTDRGIMLEETRRREFLPENRSSPQEKWWLDSTCATPRRYSQVNQAQQAGFLLRRTVSAPGVGSYEASPSAQHSTWYTGSSPKSDRFGGCAEEVAAEQLPQRMS